MALNDFVGFDESLDFIQLVEAVMRVYLIIWHAFGTELIQGTTGAMEQAHDITRVKPKLGEVRMGQNDILLVDDGLRLAHLKPPFGAFRAFSGTRMTSSSSTEKSSPRIQASISDLRNWSLAPAL
jgi:hypothetical protein